MARSTRSPELRLLDWLRRLRLVLFLACCVSIIVVLSWFWFPNHVDRFGDWLVAHYVHYYDHELHKAERRLRRKTEVKRLEAIERLEELLSDLQSTQRGDRLEEIKRRAFIALSKATANNPEYALSVYKRWLEFDPRNLTAQVQYQQILSQHTAQRAAAKQQIELLTSRFPNLQVPAIKQ